MKIYLNYTDIKGEEIAVDISEHPMYIASGRERSRQAKALGRRSCDYIPDNCWADWDNVPVDADYLDALLEEQGFREVNRLAQEDEETVAKFLVFDDAFYLGLDLEKIIKQMKTAEWLFFKSKSELEDWAVTRVRGFYGDIPVELLNVERVFEAIRELDEGGGGCVWHEMPDGTWGVLTKGD